MSGRIVTPQGFIPGDEGKPDRPPTLQERLDLALKHWQFKRKDEAFATALNSIAYLSSGLAGMAKLTDVMRSENDVLRKRIDELEKTMKEKFP